MKTTPTTTIVSYKSQSELARAHPQIRSFKLVHHAPRGQSIEAQQAALSGKGVTGIVYQIGDFFYQAKDLPANCTCLQYVGDDDCPHHGRRRQPCPAAFS